MTRLRNNRGNAITETGPALWFFLVMILFPMFDVFGIGTQFGATWYLNHLMTREMAVTKSGDWTARKGEVLADFKKTGIPHFVHMVDAEIKNDIQAIAPDAANGNIPNVKVVTSVVAKPFLFIPLPVPVEGLNKDITIGFVSERPREQREDNQI